MAGDSNNDAGYIAAHSTKAATSLGLAILSIWGDNPSAGIGLLGNAVDEGFTAGGINTKGETPPIKAEQSSAKSDDGKVHVDATAKKQADTSNWLPERK